MTLPRFALALAIIAGCSNDPTMGDKDATSAPDGGDAGSLTPDASPDASPVGGDVGPDANMADASNCAEDALPVAGLGCVRWRATQMYRGRWEHATSVLADGRVFAVGGRYRDHPNVGTPFALDSAEIFDPATEVWTEVSPMPEPRYQHTASVLPDGRVLVVGGNEVSTEPDQVALFWSSATDAWSPAPDPPSHREEHRAVTLDSGEVLLFGGFVEGSRGTGIDIFDPSSETWRTVASTNPEHGIALPDGRVFFVGGGGPRIFDIGDDSFDELAPMPVERSPDAIVVLPGGDILVAGDLGGFEGPESVERYRVDDDSWTTIDLPRDFREGSATVLASGHVVLTSYHDDFEPNDNGAPLLVDPEAGRAVALPGAPTIGRAHQTVRLGDGSVLFVGGYQGGFELGGVPTATVFEWLD